MQAPAAVMRGLPAATTRSNSTRPSGLNRLAVTAGKNRASRSRALPARESRVRRRSLLPERYSRGASRFNPLGRAPRAWTGGNLMASLLVLRGDNPDQRFKLEGDLVVLGRNPDCQIIIPSHAVSRQHAQIAHQGGRFFIE